MKRFTTVIGLVTLMTLGCGGPSAPQSGGEQSLAPRSPTTLRYVSRFEAATLAARFTEAAGTSEYVKRPFNAGLAVTDGNTQPRPVLAEQLPQLNSSLGAVAPRPPGGGIAGASSPTARWRPPTDYGLASRGMMAPR